MGKTKKLEAVVVPVETVLNLIELATARGMQRGAQMVLAELQEHEAHRNGAEKAPEAPQSPFLGDTDTEAGQDPTRTPQLTMEALTDHG